MSQQREWMGSEDLDQTLRSLLKWVSVSAQGDCNFALGNVSTLKYAYPWPLLVSVRDHFASFMSTCANTLDRSRYFESETFLIRRHYCDVWYIHVDVLDVNVPAAGPCSFMDSTHVFYSLDSLIHFYIHTHILWGSPPVCWVKKFPPVSGSVVLDHGAMTWCLFLDYPGMYVAPVNLVEGSSPHRDSACVGVYL